MTLIQKDASACHLSHMLAQIILLEKHGDKIGPNVNGNLYYLKSIVFHEGKSIENGHYKSKL